VLSERFRRASRNAPGKGGDVGAESLASFWLLPGALGLDLALAPPIRAVSGWAEAEHSAMRAGEGGGRLLRAGGQAQERSKNNPKKLGWREKIPFLLRQAQHERNFFGSPNG
jgi:hypothetical protein